MSKPSSLVLTLVLLSFTAAGCAEQKGRKKKDDKADKADKNKHKPRDNKKTDGKK